MNPKTTQSKIDQLSHEVYAAEKSLKQERRACIKARTYLANIKAVQEKAQIIAQTIQQQAHARIAGVVTSCLHSVFTDDVYDFQIRFERKRGKSEASLVLIKNGHVIENPTEEDSGGVVNVAAFVLRLACIVSTKPRLRKFIAMDEPFHHVSKKYRPAVRSMIKQLAEDFGFQFLLVTHEPEYMTGKVIKL